jgi:hypothetical protein
VEGAHPFTIFIYQVGQSFGGKNDQYQIEMTPKQRQDRYQTEVAPKQKLEQYRTKIQPKQTTDYPIEASCVETARSDGKITCIAAERGF